MDIEKIHVGKLVEDACKQSNYKLIEIAEKAGVSKQTLNGWFKKDDLKVKNLFTISKVLGTDLVAKFNQPKDTNQPTKIVLQIEIEQDKSDEVLKYIKDKKLYELLKSETTNNNNS